MDGDDELDWGDAGERMDDAISLGANSDDDEQQIQKYQQPVSPDDDSGLHDSATQHTSSNSPRSVKTSGRGDEGQVATLAADEPLARLDGPRSQSSSPAGVSEPSGSSSDRRVRAARAPLSTAIDMDLDTSSRATLTPVPVPAPNNNDQLPTGWSARTSSTGAVYFFHSLTGKTQWERPEPDFISPRLQEKLERETAALRRSDSPAQHSDSREPVDSRALAQTGDRGQQQLFEDSRNGGANPDNSEAPMHIAVPSNARWPRRRGADGTHEPIGPPARRPLTPPRRMPDPSRGTAAEPRQEFLRQDVRQDAPPNLHSGPGDRRQTRRPIDRKDRVPETTAPRSARPFHESPPHSGIDPGPGNGPALNRDISGDWQRWNREPVAARRSAEGPPRALERDPNGSRDDDSSSSRSHPREFGHRAPPGREGPMKHIQHRSRTPPPPANQRSSGEYSSRGEGRHVSASSEASREQGEWRSSELGRIPDDRRGMHDRPPHMRPLSPPRGHEADAKRRRVADDPDSTLARRRIHEDGQPPSRGGNGLSANDPASKRAPLPPQGALYTSSFHHDTPPPSTGWASDERDQMPVPMSSDLPPRRREPADEVRFNDRPRVDERPMNRGSAVDEEARRMLMRGGDSYRPTYAQDNEPRRQRPRSPSPHQPVQSRGRQFAPDSAAERMGPGPGPGPRSFGHDSGREAQARFSANDAGPGGPRQERKRPRDEHPEPFGGAPRQMRQWGPQQSVDAPPSPPPEPSRRLPQNGGPPRGDFYRPMEDDQQRNANDQAHNGPLGRGRFNRQGEDIRMRDDHAQRRGRDWDNDRGRPHIKEDSPPRPVQPPPQGSFRGQRDPVSFGAPHREHDMPRGHTHSPRVTRPPLVSHQSSSYNGQRDGPPPPGPETRTRGRSFSGVDGAPSPLMRGLPQQEDMFRARVEREASVVEPGPSTRARGHSFNDAPRNNGNEFGAGRPLTIDTGGFSRNHVSPAQRMNQLPQPARGMHPYSRSPEMHRGQQLPSAGPGPGPNGGRRSAHNSPTAGPLNMQERYATGRAPNNNAPPLPVSDQQGFYANSQGPPRQSPRNSPMDHPMTISPRVGPPRPLLVGRQSDAPPPRARGENGWNNRGGPGRSQSFRGPPPRERGRSMSPPRRQFEDAPMDEDALRLGLSFDTQPPPQMRGLSLKDRIESSGGAGRPPPMNGVHPDRLRHVQAPSQRTDPFGPDSRSRRQPMQEYDGPRHGDGDIRPERSHKGSLIDRISDLNADDVATFDSDEGGGSARGAGTVAGGPSRLFQRR